MTDPATRNEQGNDTRSGARPLWFTILCVASWVFYGFLTLFFLLALLYAGWIGEVTRQYVTDDSWAGAKILTVLLAGFLLHALAFGGITGIWKRWQGGYYLFALPTLLLAAFHLLRPGISWVFTAVYIAFVILHGISVRLLR